MAIIEIIGGPITHKYLMGKTKHDLADMYMRLLRETASDAGDAARYRWLRAGGYEHADDGLPHIVVTRQGSWGNWHEAIIEDDEADAAIDAAMHAPGGAGESGEPLAGSIDGGAMG